MWGRTAVWTISFLLKSQAARAFVVDATDQKASIQPAACIDGHLWLHAHSNTPRHHTSIGSLQPFNMRLLPLHHLAFPVSARWKSNERQSCQVPQHCTIVSTIFPSAPTISSFFFPIFFLTALIGSVSSPLNLSVFPPWSFLRLLRLRLSLSCRYAPPLPAPFISACSSTSRSVDISGSLYVIAKAQSAADPLLLGQC